MKTCDKCKEFEKYYSDEVYTNCHCNKYKTWWIVMKAKNIKPLEECKDEISKETNNS